MLGFHLVSWLVMAVFGGYLSERSTWALQRRGIASPVVKTTWLSLGVAFFTYILQGVAWLVVQLCAVSDPQAELQLLLPLYLLTPFLVNLMWIDAAHHLLPNRLVYPALALALGCFSVLGLLQGNYRALLGVWVAPLLYGVFMLFPPGFRTLANHGTLCGLDVESCLVLSYKPSRASTFICQSRRSRGKVEAC